MAATKFPIVSPLGRIVEGDPWTPQEKDSDGNLRVFKHGPKAGQPNPQYYVGLAVEKFVPGPNGQPIENPDFASFYGFVDAIARAAWPHLFPNGGPCVSQDFSWKIKDGDGFVKKGKNAGQSLAERPGHKGCWIISFATSFAPQIVVETAPSQYAEITDQSLLQRGYYVRIGASVSSNESTNTPGLYVNLEKVELKGRGEVINTGASAAQVFGAAQAAAYVPAGMQALTAADLASAPAGLGAGPAGQAPQPGFPSPQAGGFPAPMAGGHAPIAAAPAPGGFAPGATAFPGSPAPGAAPLPGFAPAPAPGPGAPGAPIPGAGVPTSPTSAAPYSGFMPGAAPAPAPAPAPAASPQRVMTAAAGGHPYETFTAQGWTDETLVAQGYMVWQ